MVSIFRKLINTQAGFTVAETEPAMRVKIATCAILMAVAGADEFTNEERQRIVEILQNQFSLTNEDAAALMEHASREVDKAVDYWHFADTLNHSLSDSERIKIMENIWRIIYTDGRLSGHEDTIVHKFSFLMGLTHEQMIAAKLRVRNEEGLDKLESV